MRMDPLLIIGFPSSARFCYLGKQIGRAQAVDRRPDRHVYDRRVHSALGVSPLEKYEDGILGTATKPGRGLTVRCIDETKLRLAVKGRGLLQKCSSRHR